MSFNFPYTALSLTQSINMRPNVYGLLQSLGVAKPRPIPTTTVRIDIQSSKVKILPAVERGGPATPRERVSDQARLIGVPSFPSLDVITPADIQDMQEVQGNQLVELTPEAALLRRLDEMRVEHDQTLEYLRMGAIKGLIKDGSGRTILDLFTAFEIAKKQVDFDLDTPGSNIDGVCAEVVQHVSTKLAGEQMRDIVAICAPDFFTKLITHPKCEAKYLNQQDASDLRNPERVNEGGSFGRRFRYGNILFIEYFGEVELQDGTVEPLADAGKCHIFPLGTVSAFETYLAPPNHMEFVNKPGAQIYLSPEPKKHGEGVEIKGESCPLPVFKLPQALVEGIA